MRSTTSPRQKSPPGKPVMGEGVAEGDRHPCLFTQFSPIHTNLFQLCCRRGICHQASVKRGSFHDPGFVFSAVLFIFFFPQLPTANTQCRSSPPQHTSCPSSPQPHCNKKAASRLIKSSYMIRKKFQKFLV